MKKINLAFGFLFLFLWTNSAFAQHEGKIDLKIAQLTALSEKIDNSLMFQDQKSWAQLEISQSIVLLESNRKEENIKKLQAVEFQINVTNQGVIEALMLAQKKRLLTKVKVLDSLILEYAQKGVNTLKLEQLKRSMLQKIEAIN